MKAYRIFVLIVLFGFFMGCAAKGPIWKREVSFSNPTTPVKGKKVIVARFLATTDFPALLKHAMDQPIFREQYMRSLRDPQPGYLQPGYLQLFPKYMLESADVRKMSFVQDISRNMTSELVKMGIAAEVRLEAKPSEIKGDEILLRGAAIATPYKSALTGCLYNPCISIFIPVWGTIIPYPTAASAGAAITCRLELIDSSGNILSQTQDENIVGHYEYHWLWSEPNFQTSAEKLLGYVPGKIALALEKILR